MLFEDRLAGELYRPIGLEWANEGFWAVYDHPATQQQYLTLAQGYQPEDGTPPLNQIIEEPHGGIYFCQDIDSGYYNKAITLPAFKELKFDIVIASLPQHIAPFQKLIDLYQPEAKLIFQVGNQWDGIHASNIMASAKLSNMPDDINWVEYHQEFDLNVFKPAKDTHANSIKSLMNCPDVFPDYNMLLELEQQLPSWDIKIHGGQGRDGSLNGADEVADAIRHSQFVWHVKAGGDGYGHVLFNTAACGVPTIVKKSYYAGKLGEKLLIDGVTCIDIDGLSVSEIAEHLKYYSETKRYAEMKQAVIDNFQEQVDFNKDEANIRRFIEGLI